MFSDDQTTLFKVLKELYYEGIHGEHDFAHILNIMEGIIASFNVDNIQPQLFHVFVRMY